MANEKKLTVKRVITGVCLIVIGVLGLSALYFAIVFFTLPFTRNGTISWILGVAITMGITVFIAWKLNPEKKRRNRS